MLDTFRDNPTIVPDFTKVDLEDAAKFLTPEDVVTPKKTEGVKTKLVQTKARQLTNLADLDIESSPLIKEATKTQLVEFQNKQYAARERKMKEEGQLKELLQEKNTLLQQKDEKLQQKDEKLQEWATYKNNRRENLLNKIPENDRMIYSDLSLENLEAHVNKILKPISSKTSTALGQRGSAGEFGGYSSMEEWAAKDPVGCEKHLSDNVSGYSWGKVR